MSADSFTNQSTFICFPSVFLQAFFGGGEEGSDADELGAEHVVSRGQLEVRSATLMTSTRLAAALLVRCWVFSRGLGQPRP